MDGLTQAVAATVAWLDAHQSPDQGAWHDRETAEGGMVGNFCTECGNRWPCDTRLTADGTYVEPESAP